MVIGGGPAGCGFAARAAKGALVTVLEEHPEIGRPVQCTGLVAPRVVDMAEAKESVLCALRGARFHFPFKTVVDFRSKDVKAFVVDRQVFDQRCAEIATDAGAKILMSSRLIKAIVRREGVDARFQRDGTSEKCLAGLIVGADGYKSRVSEIAGLPPARERIKGIQVDLDIEDRSDVLDVHVGSKVAPGFFAWRIPCGDFVRVGVCISEGNGPPSQYLRSLLKRLELEDAKVLDRISGVIPIGFPPRTYADRTMLIGDAAGQAKPLSGGGLYTGMTAATIAAGVALAALQEGDLSAERLSEYQRKWKEEIGRELERGYLMRKAYLRLSDKRLEALGRTLDRSEVKEVLSSGDIDFPSLLAPRIIKAAPKLLRFAPQVLRSMFSRTAMGMT